MRSGGGDKVWVRVEEVFRIFTSTRKISTKIFFKRHENTLCKKNDVMTGIREKKSVKVKIKCEGHDRCLE